ncbi:hypothetical protein KUTeg_010420 [Tegillarca granosa]|uniref:CUE domain-containing protein n=1 Tax=Tegillarca granosa TaxID=220873 RepID=A0ABQ9FB23_TEGGR|nr:hypothetical protein KUTeg_010420 [Tegillarca granosa]
MATADTQPHKPSSRRRRTQAHRPENEFIPNNEANDSPPSTPAPPPPRAALPKRPTKQLDFNQAMSDFKCMFPTMDNDVIEAVLRANDGAVDATIDQLLTMSIDCDGRDSPDDLDIGLISQVSAYFNQLLSMSKYCYENCNNRDIY